MNGVQDMSQNIINQVVLIKFVGNTHVYQEPGSSFLIAVRAIGAHKPLFTVQFVNIFTSVFLGDLVKL